MAALRMLLTAVDEGLGAFFFWIMRPAGLPVDNGEVQAHISAFRGEFGIPDDHVPIGAIAIGYRAEGLPPQNPDLAKRRRDLADVVHYGQWGGHDDRLAPR